MSVHQAKMAWTPEQVKELLHLRHVERWTDSALAKHFKTTRSVIAGKLSRERIKAGYVPMKRGPLGHSRALPGTGAKPSLPSLKVDRIKIPKGPKVDFGLITEGTGSHCTLVDLQGCKWPVGEVEGHKGRHIFCNAPRPNDPRQPYCDHHRSLAGERYRVWTKEDDIKIKTEWRRGEGKNRLAQMLYRTKSSIAIRARQLGLPGAL